jgi:hypothetical protein
LHVSGIGILLQVAKSEGNAMKANQAMKATKAMKAMKEKNAMKAKPSQDSILC